MQNIRKKSVSFLFATAGFLLASSLAAASPCPVSKTGGTGRETLPYAIAEHNTYGTCDYEGDDLIYFDEDLDGEEIVIDDKQTITRSGLTIGDSVVSVTIDATGVNDDCVFECDHTTYFVNIESVTVSEGVDVFCDDICEGDFDIEEVEVDCEDSGLADTDGDGICDNGPDPDNCIADSNPAQADGDGDGIGDACDNCAGDSNDDQDDFDEDGDGDACDNCPYESNSSQRDSDGDGMGNSCDNCPDDSNSSQEDTDGDGEGNACDDHPDDPTNGEGGCESGEDSDGDGVCDTDDAFPGDAGEQYDSDGDGVGDNADNCVSASNSPQLDSDGDGDGDACDTNDDNDDLDDWGDNCPTYANTGCGSTFLRFRLNPPNPPFSKGGAYFSSEDCRNTDIEDSSYRGDPNADADGDGVIDYCDACPGDPAHYSAESTCEVSVTGDNDLDGVDQAIDNCAENYNPDQTDGDGDGSGDACDDDGDGDGYDDRSEDNCPSVSNSDQADSDGDGVGDACDNEGEDADGDGEMEGADFDDVPDFIDPADEGISEEESAPEDDDGNGFDLGDAGNGCSLEKDARPSGNPMGILIIALFILFIFSRRKVRWPVTLFVFLIILSACGGNETPADPEEGVADETASFFPHSTTWAEPAEHGVTALERYQNGDDATIGDICQACHGEDLTGGAGPSCISCHAVFPHPWGEWTDTGSSDFHGLTATANGIQETCGTECHGTDFAGGLSNKSCYSCHELVPHVYENPSIAEVFDSESSVWSDYSVHGQYVQENNAVAEGLCSTNCHGTDYAGGLTGVTCFDCHPPYPHAALSGDWKNDHRGYVNTHGDGSCSTANGCHTNKNFGPSTVVQSCTDFCHQEN